MGQPSFIPEGSKKLEIIVDKNLHDLMRQFAKRRQVRIGMAYNIAIEAFLKSTEAYMGSKRERQLKRGA